jgi:small subunit ribosomal protein S3
MMIFIVIIMKERLFIQKAKEHTRLEEFIRSQFRDAKCGDIEVQYTPIVTRIIIHTTTPGLIIGSGGERIKETMETVKRVFKIENPQIDVQKIENPDMDPNIVAQSIAASIENGVNVKRLGNFFLERVMDAGAVGCEIIFAGKFGGQRGKTERFIAGYLKKCGEPARTDVIYGHARATPRLGVTGVTVKIMIKQPEALLKITQTRKTMAENELEKEQLAAVEKRKEKEEAPIEKEEAREEFMEEKGSSDASA